MTRLQAIRALKRGEVLSKEFTGCTLYPPYPTEPYRHIFTVAVFINFAPRTFSLKDKGQVWIRISSLRMSRNIRISHAQLRAYIKRNYSKFQDHMSSPGMTFGELMKKRSNNARW